MSLYLYRRLGSLSSKPWQLHICLMYCLGLLDRDPRSDGDGDIYYLLERAVTKLKTVLLSASISSSTMNEASVVDDEEYPN